MVRAGCSFVLVLGGVSPGIQRSRATDRAVTLWGSMKRGSCPTKVGAICSLANLMAFWAADLIRRNLRSPAWEAALKDAAPKDAAPSSFFPQQAHALLRMSAQRPL